MPNPYSAQKLDAELKAAGLDIDGCNSNGVVWMKNGRQPTVQDLAIITQVKASHDPLAKTPRETQLDSLKSKIDNETASVIDLMRYIKLKGL